MLVLGVVVALAGWIAACGSDDGGKEKAPARAGEEQGGVQPKLVDTASLETQLKAVLNVPAPPPIPNVRPSPGVKVRSVTCPPEVEQRRGDTFTCEVKAVTSLGSASKVVSDRVRLRQRDGRGRRFSYRATFAGEGVKTTVKGTTGLPG